MTSPTQNAQGKTVHIKSTVSGQNTEITNDDGSPLGIRIRKAEVTLAVDAINTATLHAVAVSCDVVAQAVIVCDCPHCGKQVKVL